MYKQRKNVVEEQVKKEICKKLFCFWIYRLYLAAKSVKATEPDFIKGLKFIDLEDKDVLELATTYNNGFNIRNFYQISKLRILYQLKENEEVRLIGGSIRGENKSIHNMVPEGMKEMYERIRKTEIEEFIKLYEEELIYDMDSCLGDGWLYEDEKGRMYLTNCYREGGE